MMKKTICLTVILFTAIGFFGGCSKKNSNSNITAPAPIVDFSYVIPTTPAPVTVSFGNTSANATSYEWDFGDSTTSKEARPSHIYNSDGVYVVKLTATGDGGTSSTTKTLAIQNEIVTDGSGNVYHTVRIGTQVWMKENLKTEVYRNGAYITNETNDFTWEKISTGAYRNYGNSEANATAYGRLYNWFAATDSRNIAPKGWHVPTDADWTKLIDYLGGDTAAIGKMKENGTSHWSSPNSGASNSSGFSGLPGGLLNGTRTDVGITQYGVWWSASAADIVLSYNNSVPIHDNVNPDKTFGLSIRLVKD